MSDMTNGGDQGSLTPTFNAAAKNVETGEAGPSVVEPTSTNGDQAQLTESAPGGGDQKPAIPGTGTPAGADIAPQFNEAAGDQRGPKPSEATGEQGGDKEKGTGQTGLTNDPSRTDVPVGKDATQATEAGTDETEATEGSGSAKPATGGTDSASGGANAGIEEDSLEEGDQESAITGTAGTDITTPTPNTVEPGGASVVPVKAASADSAKKKPKPKGPGL